MSSPRFDHQSVIITGAGSGIGFEIAHQMANEGAQVILNDLNTELAVEAAQKIQSEGGICIPVGGDASDRHCIQELIDSGITSFGKIDIAIANAGITTYGDFFNYTEKAFDQLIQVNLKGTFFLVQAVAKQMKKQGNGGRILLTSSTTGHRSHLNLEAYGMTKAGVEMLAVGLVSALSPHKITINCVAPGATLTERTIASSPIYEQNWKDITPLGKPATTQEIAHAAMMLVDKKASHITGQTIIVDGGWTNLGQGPVL